MSDLTLQLAGVHRPWDGPGFGIPVFRRGREFCVQEEKNEVVVGFRACDVEIHELLPLDREMAQVASRVGAPKLYAFVFPGSRILVADQAKLAAELRKAMPIAELDPFGEAEAAMFANDPEWMSAARAATDQLLKRPDDRTIPSKLPLPEPPRFFRWPRRALAILVPTAAAVAAAAVFIVIRIDKETKSEPIYSTALGESLRTTLEDGSWVTLNGNTEVRVRYTPSDRQIYLVRGQALFDVERNESAPFDVKADSTTFRALGGDSFAVELQEEKNKKSVEVIVSKGEVTINPPSAETHGPGSIVRVQGGKVFVSETDSEGVAARLAWRNAFLRFDHATLSSAVADFNRHNALKLRIGDPKIASLKVGGRFDASDPLGFAMAAEASFGLRFHVTSSPEGDVIVLESRAP